MKFLAGFLALLISHCSGFYSVSVDIANTTITSSTNFTFTVALASNYPTIPDNFRIVVALPPQVNLPSPLNTLPNYCTVLDFTEIVITTLYNPNSPSIGQTDSDYDGQCGVTAANTVTIIAPYAIPVMITFKIGLIINPSIAYNGNNLGNIQLYGYNPGSTTYSYYYSYSFGNGRFAPGALDLTSFQQSNVNVGGWTTYTYIMILSQVIPNNGFLILSFTSDIELSTASNTLVTASLNSASTITLGVSISGTVVTCSGLFPTGASSGESLELAISLVKNPKFVGYSTGIFYTATNNNEYIEMATVSIASTNPCIITLAGYIPVSTKVLVNTQIALYFSNDVYQASVNTQFYFMITFPTTYTVQSTSTCVNAGGLSTSPTLSCMISGNQLTSNLVTQIDKTVSLRLNNIINPPNNMTTSYVQIYLYTSANVLICMNQQLVNFTATPGSLSLSSKVRSSDYVADPGPYNLSFTSADVIPAGSNIKVVIPLDQFVQSSSIQCWPGTSTSNICTKAATPLDPSTVELTMTEWCSATDLVCVSCCSAGTTFTLSLQGVQNPMYINTAVSSNIRLYTYNPLMTGVIDMNTAGGVFTPSLVSRSITGTLANSGNTVQLSTVYTWTFTSQTTYTSGANIVFTLPVATVFVSSTGISCTNQGISVTCSYIINNDGSLASLSVSPCTAACPAGTAFQITLSGIKNPTTVASIAGSFGMTAFYSGYIIETGLITNTLTPLVTNQITAFSAVRTSDIVSASISLTLSFTIASQIPANGLISLVVPINVLTLLTSLALYKGTTLLSYTGSLTSISIGNYCTTACSAGSVVSIIFTGIKNLDSVQAITGLLQVTTSSGGANIDYSSVEISSILNPLLPGAMYNVDVHPINPTVSTSTGYRIIFTSQHTIPAGASIQITFPTGPVLSITQCVSYLNIGSSLTCSTIGSALLVANGFSTTYTGSYMIGIIAYSVMNPVSAQSYQPISIDTFDSNGYLIDQYLGAQVQYFLATMSVWQCAVPGNDPFLQDYSCQEVCSSGYFLVTTLPYTCIKCHYTCAQCTSSLSSACTACAPGLYKSDGYCLTYCPSGTSAVNGICTNLSPCTSPCSTCSTSTTYCLQCLTDALVSGTGNCVSPCPSGYYTTGNTCTPCDTTCATCSGSSSLCTSCYSYYSDQYLYENTCVSSCPTGITVLVSGVCTSCDVSCATCTAVGPSGCSSCSGSNYLYETTCVTQCPSGFYRYEGNVCVQVCPPGFFITSDSLDCDACNQDCALCSGPTSYDCIDCPSDLPLLLPSGACADVCGTGQFLYMDVCMVQCPDGYYGFEENYTCIATCPSGYFITTDLCLQCDSTCVECSGPTSTDCTVCPTSLPYLLPSGACGTACLTGQYLYETSCLIQCPSGYYGFEGNYTCIQTCPSGYFITGDLCLECDSTCEECNGSTSTSCTVCPSTLPYMLPTNACAASCQTGQYLYGTSCLIQCPSGYYGFEGNYTCIQTCPSSYFITGDLCLKCDSTCAECNGALATDCTVCPQALPYMLPTNACAAVCGTGEYLYEDTCYTNCPSPTYSIDLTPLACVTQCPSNYYLAGTSCIICESGCSSCEAAGTCDICDTGYSLSASGLCLLSCPVGYISVDGVCLVKCTDSDCAECTIQAPGTCEQCKTSFVLYNGACYTSCPLGTFESSSNCLACSTSCVYCNSSTSCTQCATGSYLFGSACHSTCPDGYYEQGGICAMCDPTCSTCSDVVTCNTCVEGLVLFESHCISQCPSNTKQIGGSCDYYCGASCVDCNQGVCEGCSSGVLYAGECTESCPSGFYSNSSVCQACAETCQTCTGPLQCDSCSSGFLYEGTCYTQCPTGTLAAGTECTLQCTEHCTDCTPEQCTSCEADFYLYKGNCTTCPGGTYIFGGTCADCQANCSSCTSNYTCTACSAGFLMYGECLDRCPEGFSGENYKCERAVYTAESYAVYPLIGELGIVWIIVALGAFIRADAFLLLPTAMALTSVVETSAKIALLVAVWMASEAAAGLIVAAAAALLFGGMALSVMFLYLHLEPMESANATVGYYKNMHRLAFIAIKIAGMVCGVHIFRILYCGIFGFGATTEGKSLGISASFRYPLEKLSQINALLVNLPLILVCLTSTGVYPVSTGAWQVSMFTLVLHMFTTLGFLLSYYKSPWKS